MARSRIDLPAGALELVVLKSLSRRPEHGYGLSKTIRIASEEALSIEEGSLYPALHRMERKGWIGAEWGETTTGREAKFYRLTKDGRAELRARTNRWSRMTEAVGRVLAQGGRS